MIERFETTGEDILRTKDNGLRYRLCQYTYTNDDNSQRLGLDITRVHPGKPSDIPFLYSFCLELRKNSEDMDPQTMQRIDRSFDRRVKKIPGITEERHGLVFRTPDENELLVNLDCYPNTFSSESETQIGITVAQDFDKQIQSLDRVVASLPYAVGVFNQLSPLQIEQEVVDRTIRIARESDLIRHRSLRRK